MIEAIGRINERYAKRIIESQSVKKVKTWSPDDPTRLKIEPHTTKSLICINPRLSLPNGGDWIEVCYLLEDAFSLDPVKKDAVFVKEMELYSLLAEISGMVGIPKIDVDILQRQSPNKALYNDYRKGMEELRKIVEKRKEHDWGHWKVFRLFASWRSQRGEPLNQFTAKIKSTDHGIEM